MLFRRRFPQAKNEIPLWVSRSQRSERRCVPLRRAPRWRRTPRFRSRRRSAGCRGQGACRWSSTHETGPRAGTSCRTSRTLLALPLLTNGFKVRPQDIKDYEEQFTVVRSCTIIQVLNIVRLCHHCFYTVRTIRILFLYQRTKALPMRWFNLWTVQTIVAINHCKRHPWGSNPSPCACEAQAIEMSHHDDLITYTVVDACISKQTVPI